MDSNAIISLVREILDKYHYELPAPRSTIGVPWTEAKVNVYVEKLKSVLVNPYLLRFELRETYEQVRTAEPTYAEFWVVAEGDGGYLEWYDPSTNEFGLGILGEATTVPVSIGVRGDLVGVFCAI